MTGPSLQLRLLAMSLAVASLGIVATALLATYSTGTQLRDELESDASLLEIDSQIRSALLTYATEHDTWDEVEPLVGEIAEQTGRRIALTSPDGEPIIDSAELVGQGPTDLPAVPSARIDAAQPSGTFAMSAQRYPSSTGTPNIPDATRTSLSYGWQMTEKEREERETLASQATECLAEEGIETTLRADPEASVFHSPTGANTNADTDADPVTVEEAMRLCVPDELYAPSTAAHVLNDEVVELATACLDERGLDYDISTDSFGMREVRPVGAGDDSDNGARVPPVWTECAETAQVEAVRPYVAPPVDLYLGTSDRFDPFSAEGWWRTVVTTAVILFVAATITVLAGRRLIRPIHALTAAAQRMATGDRTARVATSGSDEVTRLAQAFNAMAESIESNDLQRKALVSDVAHELRNPLANVRSHLEAAEDGVLPLDTDLVQSLLEESELLERLVSDLQDLALADAGMLRVHPEERDATDIAEQAVAAHRAQAESSGVTLGLDTPGPVPLHADPGRLRQALGNLVSNAVTHTPDGGAVEVAVRRAEDAVVFTVTDTGSGIAPEHLQHVFDRFYRADPSRSRATGGSGLGLAITKHLVEAHGGRVDVTSSLGEGSVFTARVPRGQPGR